MIELSTSDYPELAELKKGTEITLECTVMGEADGLVKLRCDSLDIMEDAGSPKEPEDEGGADEYAPPKPGSSKKTKMVLAVVMPKPERE